MAPWKPHKPPRIDVRDRLAIGLAPWPWRVRERPAQAAQRLCIVNVKRPDSICTRLLVGYTVRVMTENEIRELVESYGLTLTPPVDGRYPNMTDDVLKMAREGTKEILSLVRDAENYRVPGSRSERLAEILRGKK